MPQDVAVAAFVFGAILVLLALLGGSFKLFGAEITGTTGKQVRIFSGIAGTIFIMIGLFNNPFGRMGSAPRSTQSETVTPSSISLQPTTALANTSEPTALPTNTPQSTAIPTDTPEPTALPTNTPQPTAIPTDTPEPTPALIAVNKTIPSKESNRVTVTLTDIEILPDGNMRWNLVFANNSQKDTSVQLYYPNTYLADKNGNRYNVIRDKDGTFGAIWGIRLPVGVSLKHWVDFPVPETSVKELTVVLSRFQSIGIADFPGFTVTLP